MKRLISRHMLGVSIERLCPQVLSARRTRSSLKARSSRGAYASRARGGRVGGEVACSAAVSTRPKGSTASRSMTNHEPASADA